MVGAAVSSPGISIVIPALNEAGIITRTLDSLQGMRQRGHEVIVVDGGSQDETIAVSTPLADRVVHAPRGRALQMKAGADMAKGTVLWFLHADTVPAENSDLLILAGLERAAPRWGYFDVLFTGDRLMLKMVALLMNIRARITRIATGDQGIFITRVLYEEIGGIPVIPLMEDIALSRRLKQSVCPTVIRQKLASSPRRWEKHGITKTIVLMWGLRLAYYLGVNPARLARLYTAYNP